MVATLLKTTSLNLAESLGMLFRIVILLLVILTPRFTAADPAAPRTLVTVHGTVLDYSNRVVEKALVSISGRARALETDANGRFTAQAPARSWVGAHKHDMIGHVVLSDAPVQRVTIRMMQGPM